MHSDGTGIECYCWESDGREPYGPKGTWKISPKNENILKINGVKNTLYFVYGSNFVKWWLDNSDVGGEFFTEYGTWFQTALYEIFRKIEGITGAVIPDLRKPDGFGGITDTTPGPVKVLWYSKKEMTESQKLALIPIYGYYEIEQVNKTISSVSEISDEIGRSDVVATDAPLMIKAEFLDISKKRVIYSKKAGRDDLYSHLSWFRIKKIEIIEEEM